MPSLDQWRRIHLGTPRPSAPRWAAPAAAAGIVLTAVGLWAQLPRPRPTATSAVLEAPVAPPTPPSWAPPRTPPTMTASRPGGVIEAAGVRWQVGSTADQVLQGDWNCDGLSTLALLRPATGDIYRFDAWAPPEGDVRGTPVARFPGARALRAGDLDGDRCDDLLVEAGDGSTTAVGLR